MNSSSNGAATIIPGQEKVFRSHDAERALESADQAQRDARRNERTSEFDKMLEGIEGIAEKINAAATRVDEAAQALIAPAVGDQKKADFNQRVDADIARGKLAANKRKDGAVAYSLPVGDVRFAGYTLASKRDAFVDHENHLEVVGRSDVHMKAAMEHAKRKWVGDDIVIHAKGEHLDRAIKYAVAAGLNVVNADRNVQEKVSVERERQAAPERAAVAPVIQRVSRSA